MPDIKVSTCLLSSVNQIKDIKETLGNLFGVSLKEEGENLVFTELSFAIIINNIPQIRKWQICAAIFEEEIFNGKGVTLSKELIREKVRNNKDFLKEKGFSEGEMSDLLEEFIRRFTDRIFKKK